MRHIARRERESVRGGEEDSEEVKKTSRIVGRLPDLAGRREETVRQEEEEEARGLIKRAIEFSGGVSMSRT